MALVEGLFFFETVLLVLGAVLFFVLVFLLIYVIVKNRPAKVVALLFPVPIVMIGFPGIQKIRFENGIVEIERRVEQLAENPDDASARRELAEAVTKVEKRPVSNPRTEVTLARAQMALGDTVAAANRLQKALKARPELSEAQHLKETLVTDKTRQVESNLVKLRENPNDPQVRRELQQDLQVIEQFSHWRPEAYRTLLKGYNAMGETQKVEMYADSLKKHNPQLLKSIQPDLSTKIQPQ